MPEQVQFVPCPMCEEFWCLEHEVHACECACEDAVVGEAEDSIFVRTAYPERRVNERPDSD